MTVQAQPAPIGIVTPQAEAARYVLLRRLAPSMRHHLVVNLQPIGMIYEVMDRRLRSDHPDIGELHQSAQKINGFARAALDSSLDVITWLAPEEQRFANPLDGVRECLGLLATSLTFRGFALRNEIAAVDGQVPRAAIRTVLTASLLCLADNNTAPAEILLAAQAGAGALALQLTLRPTEGEGGFSGDVPYRRLQWSDVDSLAAAESVTLERQGRQQVRITIPFAADA